MSDYGLQRPLIIAFAGVATLSVLYYTYSQLGHSQTPVEKSVVQPQSLQRRNAIRRSRHRRRWRRGFPSQELDYNPTERAVNNLIQRNDLRQGYGEYQNSWIFNTLENTDGVDLTLIPCNLEPLQELIIARYPQWTEYQRESLRAHMHAMFVQNFLKEEFPEGYIVSDDIITIERALVAMGVDEEVIGSLAQEFDGGMYPMSEVWRPLDEPPASPRGSPPQTDAGTEDLATRDTLFTPADHNGQDDRDSEHSPSQDNREDPAGSQNMLDLLYHISADQAKRDGYIHRSVQCNSCGVCPIPGVRYHCSNCYDYDLCETCEASQIHARDHVFYKIRIPVPSRGHIRQVLPKWYPGNPAVFPSHLPREISEQLSEETGMDRTEMDALYEQFKCIAGHLWPLDPSNLGYAIDKREFDTYFIPIAAGKPIPGNLIYDRIFAFYDTNNDGLIGFEEYIKGLADLQDKSRSARLRRIFRGYDLDGDGYVDRQDFLRVFRAHYALTKELSREKINAQEDFPYVEEEIREIIQGSQPISAAFGGHSLLGHESRGGEDKQKNVDGDLVISDGLNGVLEPDTEPRGDRAQAIANVALGDRRRNPYYRSSRNEPPADEPLMYLPSSDSLDTDDSTFINGVPEDEMNGPDPPLQMYGWPPLLSLERDDIIRALGREVSVEEITDPVDRSRVFYQQSLRLDAESDRAYEKSKADVLRKRWRRRQFYLDEKEGFSRPQGYNEPDSSDEDEKKVTEEEVKVAVTPSSRRQSMRSRSSSKVRFDDSAIDTDYETRSNTSSKSILPNERWGGFELGQAEAEIGKEMLYQAIQEGFNELLDSLFKEREDEALEAVSSKSSRHEWAHLLDDLERYISKSRTSKEKASTRTDSPAAENTVHGQDSTDLAERQNSALDHSSQSEPAELPESITGQSGSSKSPDPVPLLAEVNKFEGEDYHPASDRDLTMPQFRPDENIPKLVRKSKPAPTTPDKETLRKWLRHRKIDRDANTRGGYGKLNSREFEIRMVIDDVVNDEEHDYWTKSAELKKLAFVGTWLEMASF